MILVGIPLTDYKAYAQLDAFGSVRRAWGDDLAVSVDVQTPDLAAAHWRPLHDRAQILHRQGVAVTIGSWWDPAAYGGIVPTDVEQVRDCRIPSIVQARNHIRQIALEDPACSHVFYLDADVVPPPGALQALLAIEAPLAAGVVYGHDPRCPGLPYVYTRELHGTINNHCVRNLPKRGLYRDADFVTAGFLLVQRAVLEQVTWRPTTEEAFPGSAWGWAEDPLFCFDAQARGFGKPVVDCGLVAKHHAASGAWV
jgi:hypothetical protein